MDNLDPYTALYVAVTLAAELHKAKLVPGAVTASALRINAAAAASAGRLGLATSLGIVADVIERAPG